MRIQTTTFLLERNGEIDLKCKKKNKEKEDKNEETIRTDRKKITDQRIKVITYFTSLG